MIRTVALAAVLAGGAACAQYAGTLDGTSWQLVKFQGGDDTVLRPDDSSKYTLTFNADFGPIALTRAMCAPGSLHDRIVKHLPYVRSYVIKGETLHLSLMADGGLYEFERLR